MRTIPLTLITKGMLGQEKGVALATKGVLDLLRVGGGSPNPIGQEYIERHLCILGKKIFDYADLQCLIGAKEFVYADQMCLLGKKLFAFETINEILGQKQYELLFESYFKACKQFGYGTEIVINGKKSSVIVLEQEAFGSKLIDIEQTLNVSSQKAYKSKITRTISGGKELHLFYAKDISGKKDLTPIIIALTDLD